MGQTIVGVRPREKWALFDLQRGDTVGVSLGMGERYGFARLTNSRTPLRRGSCSDSPNVTSCGSTSGGSGMSVSFREAICRYIPGCGSGDRILSIQRSRRERWGRSGASFLTRASWLGWGARTCRTPCGTPDSTPVPRRGTSPRQTWFGSIAQRATCSRSASGAVGDRGSVMGGVGGRYADHLQIGYRAGRPARAVTQRTMNSAWGARGAASVRSANPRRPGSPGEGWTRELLGPSGTAGSLRQPPRCLLDPPRTERLLHGQRSTRGGSRRSVPPARVAGASDLGLPGGPPLGARSRWVLPYGV